MKEITVVINENGWTETLKFGDKVITKRNRRIAHGSEGLDVSWEYDEEAPEWANEAFWELSSGCHDAMFSLHGADHHDDAHDED